MTKNQAATLCNNLPDTDHWREYKVAMEKTFGLTRCMSCKKRHHSFVGKRDPNSRGRVYLIDGKCPVFGHLPNH
jgi:hypothetical protein